MKSSIILLDPWNIPGTFTTARRNELLGSWCGCVCRPKRHRSRLDHLRRTENDHVEGGMSFVWKQSFMPFLRNSAWTRHWTHLAKHVNHDWKGLTLTCCSRKIWDIFDDYILYYRPNCTCFPPWPTPSPSLSETECILLPILLDFGHEILWSHGQSQITNRSFAGPFAPWRTHLRDGSAASDGSLRPVGSSHESSLLGAANSGGFGFTKTRHTYHCVSILSFSPLRWAKMGKVMLSWGTGTRRKLWQISTIVTI